MKVRTRTIKLYSPAIVLLAMAIGAFLGLSPLGGLLYFVLGISVILHIQAEIDQ